MSTATATAKGSEKKPETVSQSEVDSETLDFRDKDEALRLVGFTRTHGFSEAHFKKLRRKLDWVIPPLCAAVYFTQYLDKTALGYASIMGFPVTGQGYNLVAFSFYIGFLVWVFPSMYIAQRLPLGKYLGSQIVLWGAVMMLHAIPKSFGPFFALRLILGMLESCVAPTLILIISMFYKKDEQGSRIAWFYMMNGVAGIFGGFLAYGIEFIPTRGSFAPWKVIYILLGALAIVVGVCVLLFMPDSPTRAHFLTHEECITAIERIRDEQGGTENKHFKREQVIEALTDVRSWLIVLATLITNIPNGGLANFTNIIVVGFGYSVKQALILSTPGGAIGIISALLLGWYSDRVRERMLPIVWSLLPTLVGAALLVALEGPSNKGALLFATWIVSTYGPSLAIIYAYNASNTSGHTKKVTVNAMTLAAFCVANIVGTETFLPKDAPQYLPGKISILVLLSAQIPLCFFIRWVNLQMNQKKRRKLEEMRNQNRWSDDDIQREREKAAFMDMTDKENPFFEYTA